MNGGISSGADIASGRAGPYRRRGWTSRSSRRWSHGPSAWWLASGLVLAVVLVGCSRGPEPPVPTESLVPSVIGVVAEAAAGPPISLRAGTTFAPPTSARVDRIWNWPAGTSDQATGVIPELLLLGGERTDGSWWYQLAGFPGPNADGCWVVVGGSFDRGDSVQLSSGLILPKAPNFEIRTHGHDDVEWFPGHQDDSICINELGQAEYFDAFIGR